MSVEQLSTLRSYNPRWLTDDDLAGRFIARLPLFEFLRGELKRTPLQGTVQALLLIGVRGSGKTTLLQRLAIAIRREPELSGHLVALSFPEELFGVQSLADLWWEACRALVEALELMGDVRAARVLEMQVEARPPRNAKSDPHDAQGLRLLAQTCSALQRRPVLLLDNFDFILDRIDKLGRKTKDPQSRTYWALREVLSSTDAPLLIGGTARISEPLIGYDKAFFDFFVPHRLGKLTLEEVQLVFDNLAMQHGDAALRERIRIRVGRVTALYELTGGNPRALVLIFDLLRQGPNSRAVDDFERLLDLSTPYYKARFEDLPEQAQVVMHALAMQRRDTLKKARFGHTAAIIAKAAGLETRIVSAQLEVLIRAGVVEKSDAPAGRVQYRIGEQLFRLWLQMRSSRRLRQQVVGLTEFLEAWFERDELNPIDGNASSSSAMGRARYSYAAGELSHSNERRFLHTHAASAVLEMSGVDSGAMFAPGDLPEDVAKLVACAEQLKRCNSTIKALHPEADPILLALLGSVRLSLAEKTSAVAKLCDPLQTAVELARIGPKLARERSTLKREGLSDKEIDLLYCERKIGRLQFAELSPEHPGLRHNPEIRSLVWKLLGALLIPLKTEAQALAWMAWGKVEFLQATSAEWAAIAFAVAKTGFWDAFDEVLKLAFQHGESARAWHAMGFQAYVRDQNYVETETCLRRAIEIEPTNAEYWSELGMVLDEAGNRDMEAETALRYSISLGSTFAWPWANLGTLLSKHDDRFDEAESAYRRALELDPDDPDVWTNLGLMLRRATGRSVQAENAFRKAIELSPTATRWSYLGQLLSRDKSRSKDAEIAYRAAIELNYEGWRLRNLGIFLAKDPIQAKEAEAVLQTALEFGDEIAGVELINLRTYRAIHPARQAVNSEDWTAAKIALSDLLRNPELVPGWTAGMIFKYEVVAPALRAGQGKWLLESLRELDYQTIAAPLLLALEAVLENAPELLDDIEPELRTATQALYRSLNAAVKKIEPKSLGAL